MNRSEQDRAASSEESSIPPELAAVLGPRGAAPSDPKSASHADDAEGADDGLAGVQAILAEERGVLAKLRALPSIQRLGIALVMVGFWPAFVLLTSRRADFGVYPIARLVGDVLILGGAVTALVVLALRPLHRAPVATWLHRVIAMVGALAVSLLCAFPMAHADHPASLEGVGSDLAGRAVACFGYGSVFGVLAAVGFLLLSRARSRWVPGVMTAGAAAVVGVLSLYMHCPITHPLHLWLGHGTVLVPFAVLGFTIARRRPELG